MAQDIGRCYPIQNSKAHNKEAPTRNCFFFWCLSTYGCLSHQQVTTLSVCFLCILDLAKRYRTSAPHMPTHAQSVQCVQVFGESGPSHCLLPCFNGATSGSPQFQHPTFQRLSLKCLKPSCTWFGYVWIIPTRTLLKGFQVQSTETAAS